MTDRMLNAQDVAKITGYCENTARAMMRKMPHFIAPGGARRKTMRVWQSDLMQFLHEHTVTPTAQKGRKKAAVPRAVFPCGLDENGRIPRRKA